MNNNKRKKFERSFFKWVGGKFTLRDQIIGMFPKEFNNYHEPFLGAGSVFFSMPFNKSKKYFLSDVSTEVISLYKALKTDHKTFFNLMNSYHQEYFSIDNDDRENMFLKIRKMDRDDEYEIISDTEKAARFLFLIKTGFNGLCRYSKSGYFNTPFGKYKNPKIFDIDNLNFCKNKVVNKNVIISQRDFRESINNIEKGDLVFIDSPYIPISKTSNFTSYTKHNFYEKDHNDVLEFCRQIDKKGAYFIQTNSYCEKIMEMYGNEFNVSKVLVHRRINRTGKGDGDVNEVIIKNF